MQIHSKYFKLCALVLVSLSFAYCENKKKEAVTPVTPSCESSLTGNGFSLSSHVDDGGFNSKGEIPESFRGPNRPFPKICWKNPPAGTDRFSLVIGDLDATRFPHGYIYNIGSSHRKIEHISNTSTEMPWAPYGAAEENPYVPPSPPNCHRYIFHLYAMRGAELTNRNTVSTMVESAPMDASNPKHSEVVAATGGVDILATATLCGTYSPDGSTCSCP